jgi:hypothetical protein
VTERKDIGARLEAWARWATARQARGADSMTGAVCERMRRAALGDVWSGHEVRDELDERDAVAIQRGMAHITLQQRLMLHWTYIEQARPEVVCRMLKLPVRPISLFVSAFRDAQTAIEKVVDDAQNR